MHFRLGKAIPASQLELFRSIVADESLSVEESRKKFIDTVNGVIEVEKEDAPKPKRGQKAAATRKANKARKEAKALVDKEIAEAKAKAEAEEE